MLTIEFGKSELTSLDINSMFIKIKAKSKSNEWNDLLARIKSYWIRVYHNDTHEWEIPFSCFDDILKLFSDQQIYFLNEPPKAQIVTDNEILNGIDFNGYNLYNYQLDGVRYGLNHHNFLLLDEMRIRKNITSNYNS